MWDYTSTKLHLPRSSEKILEFKNFDNFILVSIKNKGLSIYRWNGNLMEIFYEFDTYSNDICIKCKNISINSKYLAYFKEFPGATQFEVYKTKDVFEKKIRHVCFSLSVHQPAPYVIDSNLSYIALAQSSMKSGWFTNKENGQPSNSDTKSSLSESGVVIVFDAESGLELFRFLASDSSIFEIRLQLSNQNCPSLLVDRQESSSLLAVVGSEGDINVFKPVFDDLRQGQSLDGHTSLTFSRVHSFSVCRCRALLFVADCLAVFHWSEPNVTLRHCTASRTVLCLNLQSPSARTGIQLDGELSITSLTDNTDNTDTDNTDITDINSHTSNNCNQEQQDHVTAVTSAQLIDRSMIDNVKLDDVIIYGTRRGVVYGMTISTRARLFKIDSPYVGEAGKVGVGRQRVCGICVLPRGELVVLYAVQGLSMFEFTAERKSIQLCSLR